MTRADPFPHLNPLAAATAIGFEELEPVIPKNASETIQQVIFIS